MTTVPRPAAPGQPGGRHPASYSAAKLRDRLRRLRAELAAVAATERRARAAGDGPTLGWLVPYRRGLERLLRRLAPPTPAGGSAGGA